MDAEQQEKVEQFCQITNANEFMAADVLESHNWDVNNAVVFYLENAFATPRTQEEPADTSMAATSSPPAAPLVSPSMASMPERTEGSMLPPTFTEDDDNHGGRGTNFSAETDDNASIEAQILEAALAESLRAEGLSAPPEDGFSTPPELGVTGHGAPRMTFSGSETAEAVALSEEMDADQEELLRLQHEEWRNQFIEEDDDFPSHRPNVAAVPASPGVLSARTIRDEQDLAYQESLAADRAKEESAAKQRAEEEAQEQLRQKQEQEEQQQQQEASQKLERKLAQKAAALPPEPAADEPGAVHVRVRLPEGGQHNRRFLRSHPLQALFDSIDTAGIAAVDGYRLVAAYPRRVFTESGASISFEEAGLTSKQEALLLELL